VESFRRHIRDWIESNAPAGLTEVAPWWELMACPARRDEQWRLAVSSRHYAEWERRLLKAGLICPTWPTDYGGSALGNQAALIFREECSRAGIPYVDREIGERFVGPAILAHGTAAQKDYFLPRIVSGEDRYCQGLTEAGHGSDLASVEAGARQIGPALEISGHKAFVSGAGQANMIAVLARTGSRRAGCRGLSYVLVSLTQDNGVSYHSVRQISGQATFGDVRFAGAHAPVANVIGGLHGGWAPAMTSLAHGKEERARAAHIGSAHEFWQLVRDMRLAGRAQEPLVRAKLAWAYTQVELMRLACLGRAQHPGAPGAPGAEAAVASLFLAEYRRRFGELAVDLAGARSLVRPSGPGYQLDRWQEIFLAGRADTISAGTSEIQRNIIAEEILGLPKDPPGDAGRPPESYSPAPRPAWEGQRTASWKSAIALPSSSAKTHRPRMRAPSSTAGSQ
jgi:alkylation response protein AidB-like acyl-CoA dehydrogenase